MFEKLFSDNVRKSCKICEYSVKNKQTKERICSRTDQPTPDEACRFYKYDPIKRIPKAPPELPQFTAEDFDYR